jgi:CDP-paratose 2-epimerase
MDARHILIAGGAGFLGSNLAIGIKRAFENCSVTVFDNLRRRGSELNLPRLARHGIQFIHGDVRLPGDLAALPNFDLLIDCAAEPSVHAGRDGSVPDLLDLNLLGTAHALELARQREAAFLLLSSSRVFPIQALNDLPYREETTRFRWHFSEPCPGVSDEGVNEDFTLTGPRSLYGYTKLAAEQLVQEYVFNFRLPALVDRCSVIAGPWQMARVDQGFVALWCARHVLGLPLRYVGFGGTGKQVRDVLHVDDLVDLVQKQLATLSRWDGAIYNVGGGQALSLSLLELTSLCATHAGRRIQVESAPETSPVDLRIFITDSARARRQFQWKPERDVAQIVADTCRWIESHRTQLEYVFAG